MELHKNLQSYYLSKAGISGEKLPDAIVPAGNTNRPPAEDVFVRKVREVIERHIADPDFSVEKLSKFVFRSHSQLHRKREAITGCAPNKFIRMVRLERAKQLLQQPQHSIASVAIDCGYNDPRDTSPGFSGRKPAQARRNAGSKKIRQGNFAYRLIKLQQLYHLALIMHKKTYASCRYTNCF